MCERKKTHRQWLGTVWVAVLSLPFVTGLVVAQAGAEGQPVKRNATPGRALSVLAKPGTVIVRGRYTSESLRLIQAAAEKSPSRDKLDVAFDDYASFGRFCDEDDPFHVVICEGNLTPHHKRCWARRFPAGTPQPEAFLVGQLRVVFVAGMSNSIESLDFVGIRKSLSEKGKQLRWRDIGGVGSAAIHCYGPLDKTWARQLVQQKCMTRWRDSDQPGVRELQRLVYRDDLVSCTDAKEVIAKVRSDRHALGFFACCEPLTKRDFQGVKVLPILPNEGDPAVMPPLGLTSEQAYPFAEPLYLYVHPNAPAVAREFCKFATGAEAANIVQQFGVWPEYLVQQAHSKQRLAEVKAGKGTEIVVCDLAGREAMLEDLSLEFVKAKAAVQLKFQKGKIRDEAVDKLIEGTTELLVLDGPLSENRLEGDSPIVVEPQSPQSPDQSSSPESVELGLLAVGVIVHSENPLESLPLYEAQGIFRGVIKKWPAVRGAAPAINVVGLKRRDPITQLLKEKLVEGESGKSLKYKAYKGGQATLLQG